MYPNQVHDLAHLFSSNGFKRCVCPPDFGGPVCDIRRTKCGKDNSCFHGGTCVTKVVQDEETYHCDCSSADQDSKSYAGRFCQFESNTFCTDNINQNGRIFCVNGGTCKKDPLNIYEGCDCPTGYFGISCEFQQMNATVVEVTVDDDQFTGNDDDDSAPKIAETDTDKNKDGVADYAECNILCENNGVCEKGEKDLGLLAHLAADNEYLNITSNENFEHCGTSPLLY